MFSPLLGLALTARRFLSLPVVVFRVLATGVMNQTIAYTKLAGAVGKQVYIAEKMAPPTSLGEITSAVASVVGKARNAQYWQGLISSGEWKVVAFGVSALLCFAELSYGRAASFGVGQGWKQRRGYSKGSRVSMYLWGRYRGTVRRSGRYKDRLT
jgi:hypothetical protein